MPLLGDIPILGWLFKGRSTVKDKVNLLVFLTPKVIRSPTDSNKIITEKLDERLENIKAQGGKDPWGRKVDKLYRKAGGASVPNGPVNESEN
ncbi:putative type II secretion system protein D precursor [compost metagenome]